MSFTDAPPLIEPRPLPSGWLRRSGMTMTRAHRARRRSASRLSARSLAAFSDFFSIEASFTLYLFAGRYKKFPELQGFPVDFTLFFFVLTCALIAWALVSGRMRPFPLSVPVLLIVLFSELAAASLFWSSLDPLNKDKLVRFLVLTSPSFFAAHMFAQDRERRQRLVRMLAWISCAILLYYVYYRYVVGIDMQASNAGYLQSDNYLEYNDHAAILFVFCIVLAVLGSWRQTFTAFAGSGVALFLLATIGGRGPLARALLAIPLMGLGLYLRPHGTLKGLARLSLFVAALCVTAAVTYTTMVQIYGSETLEYLRTLDRYELQMSSEATYSMDERRDARDLAIRQWHEKPILGWGIGEFRVESAVGYPHNLLLEILMEMGLIGAFIFFPVCFVGVIESVRLMQSRSCGWAEIAVALLYLTDLASHLTVQGYLADDRYFFACLGFVVGVRHARQAWPSQSARPASLVGQRAATPHAAADDEATP